MRPPSGPDPCPQENLLPHTPLDEQVASARLNVTQGGEPPGTPKPRRRRWIPSLPKGWRGGLFLNVCLAILVLAANVTYLAWASRASAFSHSSAFPAKCENIDRLSTLSHVVVSILSAVLLSASNYTMQVLCSPKRTEVDRAHRQGTFMTIGGQSFKNLRFIGIYRVALWSLLAISSLPLHILYNSIFFPVTGAYAYMVAVTTAGFEEEAPSSFSLANRLGTSYSEPPFSTGRRTYPGREANPGWYYPRFSFPMYDDSGQSILLSLQKKAKQKELIELTPEECLHKYLPDRQRQYRNLLAVSENARSNSSVVWIYYSSPIDNTYSTWMCEHGSITSTDGINSGLVPNTSMNPPVGMTLCDPEETLKKPSKWSLGLYSIRNWTNTPHEEVWDVGSHPVSRCLAEPVTSPCALKYARNIHVVVIIANLVKVLVMIATIFQYRHPALVTVGDALASFLETPDPTAQELCLGRIEDFTRGAWNPEPKVYLIDNEACIRSSDASRTQWLATSTMLLLSGLSASIFLALIYSPQQDAFDWAFQSKIEPASLTLGRGLGTSPLIVLANIPQLIISLDYLLLNRLVTSMAGACEWSLFAHQRKTLRTSLPRGAQRSTYWLSLPLKLSIPLMAVSAALHYLSSQSLYFGSILYYGYHDDVEGERRLLENYTGLRYSQTAVHILMIVLLLSITAVMWWGRRRIRAGMPPAGFCSAVISAACHPPEGEADAQLRAVQWGEIPRHESGHGIGHCSFSSGEVNMPVVGKEYK